MGVAARKGAAALRKHWADAVASRSPLYMSAPLVADDDATVEAWAVAVTALQQQRKEMQAEILKRDTEIVTLETELARLRAAVAQQSRELEAAGEEMGRLRIASDQARSARECMHVSR